MSIDVDVQVIQTMRGPIIWPPQLSHACPLHAISVAKGSMKDDVHMNSIRLKDMVLGKRCIVASIQRAEGSFQPPALDFLAGTERPPEMLADAEFDIPPSYISSLFEELP